MTARCSNASTGTGSPSTSSVISTGLRSRRSPKALAERVTAAAAAHAEHLGQRPAQRRPPVHPDQVGEVLRHLLDDEVGVADGDEHPARLDAAGHVDRLALAVAEVDRRARGEEVDGRIGHAAAPAGPAPLGERAEGVAGGGHHRVGVPAVGHAVAGRPAEGVPHGAGLGAVGGEGPQPDAGQLREAGEVAVDEHAAEGRALEHVQPAERLVGVAPPAGGRARRRRRRRRARRRSAANRSARRRRGQVDGARRRRGSGAAQSSRPASAAGQKPCMRVSTPVSRDRSSAGSSRSSVRSTSSCSVAVPVRSSPQDVTVYRPRPSLRRA